MCRSPTGSYVPVGDIRIPHSWPSRKRLAAFVGTPVDGALFAMCFEHVEAQRVLRDWFGTCRRLNQGRFVWASRHGEVRATLTREQFDALVLGLPWQRLGAAAAITVI